jgi:hypothetical protein
VPSQLVLIGHGSLEKANAILHILLAGVFFGAITIRFFFKFGSRFSFPCTSHICCLTHLWGSAMSAPFSLSFTLNNNWLSKTLR